MKIVHEIHKGAIPVAGADSAHPGQVSMRLVGRNPITGEADVLDIEGKDEDVLAALDQMVSQTRLLIIQSGRPDPHTYTCVLEFRGDADMDGYRCHRCGCFAKQDELHKIAVPVQKSGATSVQFGWAHLCGSCKQSFDAWMNNQNKLAQSAENPACQCGHLLSDHEDSSSSTESRRPDGSCFYGYNCDCKNFQRIAPFDPDDICRCGHSAGDHAMDSIVARECGYGCGCEDFRLLTRAKDMP